MLEVGEEEKSDDHNRSIIQKRTALIVHSVKCQQKCDLLGPSSSLRIVASTTTTGERADVVCVVSWLMMTESIFSPFSVLLCAVRCTRQRERMNDARWGHTRSSTNVASSWRGIVRAKSKNRSSWPRQPGALRTMDTIWTHNTQAASVRTSTREGCAFRKSTSTY
jgi:hypothetical protein